jgi:tight adherence protein B
MNLSLDATNGLAVLSAIAAATGFAAIAAAVIASGERRRRRRRFAAVCNRDATSRSSDGAADRSLTRRGSATPGLDRMTRPWLPRREALAERLAKTGRPISIGQYSVAVIVLSVAATLALALFVRLGPLPSVVLGMAIGAWLPHLVVGRMAKRRIAGFTAHFPEAIDLMVRALRAGLPIAEAVVNAGHEVPDPVGAELRIVEAGMRLGRDLEGLLWEMAHRVDTPEVRFFVIALSVQRETGGNLAETLANLADVLRRRRQMRAKVRAMASETRATTAILGGLPVLVMLVLLLTSPGYLTPLFTDVRGYFFDGVALTMLGAGILIMNKMAKFAI